MVHDWPITSWRRRSAGTDPRSCCLPWCVCVDSTARSMEQEAEEKRGTERFLEWMRENGARFEKVSWPSWQTDSGVRGAVALEDIETNEHMIIIPEKLMMTPVTAEASEIGHILKECSDHFRGDDALTIFVMYEMAKGPASFYSPYLCILPSPPSSILHWTEPELAQLQDSKLVTRAAMRMSSIRTSYDRVVGHVMAKYPETFSKEDESYSFEKYMQALLTLQARAFGRRLQWSALVPFADCLNHANVQTKYDFNVDGNGLFRLFPTGENRYGAGSEVYNSYGRRCNAHLLLDYGFAMMGNEWDVVEMPFPGRRDRLPLSLAQRTLLLRASIPRNGIIVCSQQLCWDALTYLRVSSWEEAMVEHASRCRLDVHKPKSQEEELASMAIFRDTLIEALDKYPTTIEEDEAAIQQCQNRSKTEDKEGEEEKGESSSDDIRANLSLAITYRLTRKLVLRKQVELLDTVMRLAQAVIKKAAETPSSSSSPPSSSSSLPTITISSSLLQDQLPPLMWGESERMASYLRSFAYLPQVRPAPPSPPPAIDAESGSDDTTNRRSDSPDVMIKLPPPIDVDNSPSTVVSRPPAWAEETAEG